MEIIVNDTNIFIDLYDCELLDAFFQLPYQIHTVDVVVAELTDQKQKEAVIYYEKVGILKIATNSPDEIVEIYDFYESIKTQSNLSWADCSVLLYTKNIRNAKLLTGDRKLRSHALQEKIDVSGILYVFDELLRNRIIDFKTAAEKLKTLINKNIRLPLEEVESRLKDWTSL